MLPSQSEHSELYGFSTIQKINIIIIDFSLHDDDNLFEIHEEFYKIKLLKSVFSQ